MNVLNWWDIFLLQIALDINKSKIEIFLCLMFCVKCEKRKLKSCL
jgi:hypothetical protein